MAIPFTIQGRTGAGKSGKYSFQPFSFPSNTLVCFCRVFVGPRELGLLFCRNDNMNFFFFSSRIPAIHGAKTTKIRPPGTFCFMILQQSGYKIIKQNVPGGMVLAPCIASILNATSGSLNANFHTET